MNKLLCLIALMLSSVTVKSQLNTIYSYSFKEKNWENYGDPYVYFSTYINFYKEGLYEISLNYYLSDDLIVQMILSYGNYTINQNEIICKDLFTGCTLKFYSKGDVLIPIIMFKDFLWKYFSKEEYSTTDGKKLKSEPPKDLNEKIAEFQKSNEEDYYFEPGIYMAGVSIFEKLIIKETGEYSYAPQGITLSEGKWSRKGNLLILHDTVLNHNFYALIGKDAVTVLFFSINDDKYRLSLKRKT